MHALSVCLDPGLRLGGMGAVLAHKTPECGPVIHVPAMGHFVGDHVVENLRGCQNEPPGKRKIARRRTGPPPAPLIAN